MGKTPKVAVIGAGIVGLSSAVCIKESLPFVDITIIADKFGPETNSDVAGGLLYPNYALGETPMVKIRQWFLSSRNEALRQLQSAEGGSTGAMLMPCYWLTTKPEVNLDEEYKKLEGLVFGIRKMSQDEMTTLFGRTYHSGMHYTSVLWEPRKYMKYLLTRYTSMGGQIRKQHLQAIEELYGKFDVIVNCAGVGAASLNKDSEVFPIRGQVIRMEAPWVNYTFAVDNTYFTVPGTSYVVVGGITQKNNWSLEMSKEDGLGIAERAMKYMPNLKGAKFVSDNVGLRPGRSEVRLESEQVFLNGRINQIIHNYGHGGAGVTLSWGCAQEVTELVQECVGHTSSRL